uniref:Glyco_trans_2-like domain-containing protein n=1 Tax=Ganoderma boninense TaxID=34458 RepID=A0A5K1K123_9APHY|nr:Glyco_trans_2-like domain-containing protein [Ganoderma boninense]
MKDAEARWLQALPSTDTISDHTPTTIYDIGDIAAVDRLEGGSRDSALVILRDQPATRYVAFWTPNAPGCATECCLHLGEAILYEMTFLRTIPPHPHIVSPPVGYISRIHEGKRVLCGYLLKYYSGGPLGEPERVDAPIATRIKWAYQMASGLHHLHHVAHTYHGDIKLYNVVLDENGDAILIDLEQGRANEEHAAPELHAASLVSVGDDGRLCYSAAHAEPDSTSAKGEDGDEDGALPRLRCRDRPYDIWKDTPRAIEAAEAWAFATALQPLLADVDGASAILARCRSEDPNCRPTFEELERDFRDLYQRQTPPVE